MQKKQGGLFEILAGLQCEDFFLPLDFSRQLFLRREVSEVFGCIELLAVFED